MRLEDLEYFLLAAAEGHVGRAAVRAGISQPALSKGLARLEHELGFALFERGPKGVILTAPGQAFRDRTDALQNSLGDAIREATDVHLGSIGTLRLGCSPLYADFPFAPACVQLRRERPASRIKVRLALNDELLRDLQFGELDLTVNALSGSNLVELTQTPLFRDELSVVARQDHPLFHRKNLNLADFTNAEWVLPGTGVAARRSLEGRFSLAGLPPPRVVIEVNSGSTQMLTLLRSSDMLSLMSLSALETTIGKALRPFDLQECRFARDIGVVMRAGSQLSPLADRFVGILRELANQTGRPTA